MNFLAHIYLSGNNEQIQIGNFIGDYVKGNKYLDYPELIQKGILLHRDIDNFTDNNSLHKLAKRNISKKYKKYSGIIIDIFYDHFLAANWTDYSNIPLPEYTNTFYKLLKSNYDILPNKVQDFLPKLISNNRLLSYKDITGIKLALNKMTEYTSLPKYTNYAISELLKNYSDFNKNFELFMIEIINYLTEKYKLLD